jgi:hypothetical protein
MTSMCGSIGSFPLVEDGQIELVEPFVVGELSTATIMPP